MRAIALLSSQQSIRRFGVFFVLVVLLAASLWLPRSVQADSQEQDIIRTLAWSPDGELVVSGSEQGQVSLWDGKGQILQKLPILQERIIRILWSPNNQYFLSWSTDDRALLWTRNGKLMSVFQHCNWLNVWAIQWSADGDWLAVSPDGGPLQIWITTSPVDTTASGTGTLLASLGLNDAGDDTNLKLAWAPDGSMLAAGNRYTNIVYVWDFKNVSYWGITRKGAEATGALKVTLQDPELGDQGFVQHLEWSPDSKVLAIGYLGWTLQLWPRDKSLQTLTSYSTDIGGQYSNVEIAWSPDSKLLAFGDRYQDKKSLVITRIWSADGRSVETIPGGDNVVMGLVWSPKQVLAIAYNVDPHLDLWSPGQKTRSVKPTFDGFTWGVPEWSFDGAYLAMPYNTVKNGVTIQVWTADGTQVTTLNDGTNDENQPFDWSPKGNIIAMREKNDQVRLVDIASLKGE